MPKGLGYGKYAAKALGVSMKEVKKLKKAKASHKKMKDMRQMPKVTADEEQNFNNRS